MASAKSFVFVELLDEGIASLLYCLRAILSDIKQTTSIHITLRGPYKTDAILGFLAGIDNDAANEPILISGVGKFSIGSRKVVYLKAHSDTIQRLLFKPDFPKKRYGSNPHITIYEGENHTKADAVYDFLKKEQMYFLCKKYQLVAHRTRQLSLPFESELPINEASFDYLIKLGKVKEGILKRAEALGSRFS